jgi:oligopeptide transport system ATP-binding protein
MNGPVARIENLKVHYPIRGGFLNIGKKETLKAVDGVSLDLAPGEILGLVGESGCGKSSLGRAVMRLIKVTDGKIEINGIDFLSLHGRALRKARTQVQMIFQDPYASLDPRMTVFDILAEPAKAHLKLSASELNKKVQASLEMVGLRVKAAKKYPHEFSGGQRQRIAIARALILDPKVVIADEPVSSLDVSVQAQILNLLKDIQSRLGLSMIFISHNLAVVKYISDRIAVMYLGKIVEVADREDLYRAPQHPYTRALVSAVPIPDPKLERARLRIPLSGELPSPINPPKACSFHTRCPLVFDRCRVEIPKLQSYAKGKRRVACFEVEKSPPT